MRIELIIFGLQDQHSATELQGNTWIVYLLPPFLNLASMSIMKNQPALLH